MSADAVADAQSPATPSRPRRPTRPAPTLPANAEAGVPAAPRLSNDAQELIASQVGEAKREDPFELTPLRAHYLKKSLVQFQFDRELDILFSAAPDNVSALSYLGPPFAPPPKGAPALDLPFLRYTFQQFILTFPFMASAPKDFYSDKLQPFMFSVQARNITPDSVLDDEEDEQNTATRKKILAKVQRNLSLFMTAATKVIEQEEVVRLSQKDLERLEELARRRAARAAQLFEYKFEVNIVSVRTVTDKGRLRSRVHEEFIMRTRRTNTEDVYVSRRYGDFKTLADELRKNHPSEAVRPPPAKDHTTVVAAPPPPPQQPLASAPPSAATFAARNQQGYGVWNQASRSDDSLASTATVAPSRLAREKNRLTLRAYLASLMSSAVIANSPVMKSFLLSSPTTLSREELDDAQRREDADKVREESRKKFAQEIAARVEGLRGAVQSMKGDVMSKDGLTHIFATIKTTPYARDLPPNYLAVLEWGRISLASTLFHSLVASDTASETFTSLKRIHGLMPYFMLRTALKISNPIGMVRSVLDLFLAQPFGGRSLLQRMFTSSLTEEVKALEQDVEAVKDKVDDPIICDKIRQFVYASRDVQTRYKAEAKAEKLSVLTVVLRSGDAPVLQRAQMYRVLRAHRAHVVYMKYREQLADSDDDDGPQDDDAWLFEDLRVLTHLYSRLRDREQLIALLFEGTTSELLKDIITIFYSPLAQVYRAASIADSIGDLQTFINDLIRTVDDVEELSQRDPQRTIQAFIDLVGRHEQAFYNFVHKVHSKGEGLFDGLIKWIELVLTVMREGLAGDPLSLEFLLPHTGQDRLDVLHDLDAVALHHYKMKVAYENKLRKRFGRLQNHGDADAEEDAAQQMVDGIVGEIDFGELVAGDAHELAAENSDEEGDDEDDSSEYESASDDTDDSESDSSSEEDSAENQAKPPSADPNLATPKQQSNVTQHHHSQSLTTKSGQTPGLSTASPRQSVDSVWRAPSSASTTTASTSRSSKPLPPSPPLERPPFARTPPNAMSPLKSRKRRKGLEAPKAPALPNVSKLLPIFIEMMRPSLQPRKP